MLKELNMLKKLKLLKDNFKLLPTPAAGLALGIASVGGLWESVYDFNGDIQAFTALIAASILVALLLRFILHPQTLWNDLSHHVVGSVVPTFAMATMVVASSLTAHFPVFSLGLWLCAIVFHLVFLALFIYHRTQDMQLQHMVPSWFIPPIGLVVAVFTCPDIATFEPLCYAILVFGIVNYAILLPAMLNRLIFCDKVQAGAKPTIAVLAAPASLCLTGYLSLIEQPSPIIVAILFGIALLMTLLIYTALIHLVKLPFSPGFAAFTFPLVISAKGVYSMIIWCKSMGIDAHYLNQLQVVALFELLIATAVVIWVSACYLKCLFGKLTASSTEKNGTERIVVKSK
jgi:exfoliative toxin A/B